MPTNPNFSSQGVPVPGGYAQPSPGVTEQIESPADPSGNAYATSLASGGTANLQTANFRDSVITVQTTATAAAPTAGTVVATVTPGTAGLWEISGGVAATGTVAAAAELNNFALNKTATPILNKIPFIITSTTASASFTAIPTVVASLSAVDTVNVTAVANATASSVYQANIVCRRVG